jgi:hypothetical protein
MSLLAIGIGEEEMTVILESEWSVVYAGRSDDIPNSKFRLGTFFSLRKHCI